MKTRIIAAFGLMSLLTLTGCEYEEIQTRDGQTKQVEIKDSGSYYADLPDGRRVLCLQYNGGLSCDWNHATVNLEATKKEDK